MPPHHCLQLSREFIIIILSLSLLYYTDVSKVSIDFCPFFFFFGFFNGQQPSDIKKGHLSELVLVHLLFELVIFAEYRLLFIRTCMLMKCSEQRVLITAVVH